MATIYDTNPSELIESVAEELKKIETIKPLEWASFCKTGAHKERPPARQDWWYIRAASILRKVKLLGPIGVSKLRVKYGGLQSRGYKSERFRKGSGNIIRKILQQLEQSGLIKQDKKGLHKGRIITPKGIKLLDTVANKIAGKKPVEKKEDAKKELTKVEELVKKTKEFTEGKIPTAEKLIEEIKKEEKLEVKAKEPKKEKVPTAHELAEKKK